MKSLWARTSEARGMVLVLVATVVLWEAAVWFLKPQPIILPPPSRIWQELVATPSYFLRHAGYTLGTTVVGFAPVTSSCSTFDSFCSSTSPVPWVST